MAGPVFLSLVAMDDASCCGVHLNSRMVAPTFDLRTGRPAGWARPPPPLVKGAAAGTAMDETPRGLVRSRLLARLAQQVIDPVNGCAVPEDAPFQPWPDAAKGGVFFEWSDPPHAALPCGEAVLLDRATLRRHGASMALARALGLAQAAARETRTAGCPGTGSPLTSPPPKGS